LEAVLLEADPDPREVQKCDSFEPIADELNPFRVDPQGIYGYGKEVPLGDFMTEDAMTEVVLRRLEPWFDIEREVWGQHPTGRKCRIDAVIVPKDGGKWKRPEMALGIEFKVTAARKYMPGMKELTAWTAQAIDYSFAEWGRYGRLPIFLCPSPFSAHDFIEDPRQASEHFAIGLLSQFTVGSLGLYKGTGLSFTMQGRHRIWSERFGVEHGQRWTLAPRAGHRL
jgi:hypothetical protein